MKATATIRYVSGCKEKFEIELWGGTGAKARLEAFVQTPNLVLQTPNELLIIPGSAIECISITLPDEADGRLDLDYVRAAERLD